VQIKKLFLKSEFTKNTLILVSGTVLAQSIPIVNQLFLRRIYTVEDFGAMTVFLSVFSMITIVSSFRYEATIVLPKNNNEAANILSLTFIISLLFNASIFLSILFFKEIIVEFIGLPIKYANFLYLLPITSFLFSFYQSLNYWLIRQKAFKASSTNKIIRRLTEGVVQLTLGVFKIPGGLFIGDFTGNFSNVLSGIRQSFKNSFSLKNVSKRKMNFVFKKYIEYPKYNAIPTLLSSAGTLLPFLFINKMYSTETVGYLDLSRMVLSIPLVFISATIAQVLFQQITAHKHENKSIKKDLLNILFLLIGIISIETIILFLFGDSLFSFVFGDHYILSSQFSKVLILSFSLNFITSTFSSIYITFNKIKLNSIWQVFYFMAICSLLLIRDVSIIDFLKCYVAIEIIMHTVNLILLFVIVKKYEQTILV
jgi:O-antigen/teichoic acid export membrane protein